MDITENDFNMKRNKNIINILTVVFMTLFVIATVWGYNRGILTSRAKLDSFIMQTGLYGPFIFVFLQIVQVVIPIIPGGVTSIAGVFLFGPLWGTIYNYVGIVTGSYINYFLARYYGIDLVEKLIGKHRMKKYTKYMKKGEKFDRFFAIAIFLPIAPDDILCMFAGLFRMNLLKFTLVILFLKPWSLLAYTLGGNVLINKFLMK